MKKLQYFLFGFGIFLMLIFFAGAVAPKEYYYTQQVTVRSDIRTTFRQMATFERWRSWEPWSAYIDRDTFLVNGLDGKPGTKASWSNISKQPEYIQFEDVITNERLKIKMRLGKPFDAVQNITFNLEPLGNQIIIHSALKGQCPFPFNAFRSLMKPEKKLCALLDKALINIKQSTEHAERTFSIKGRRVFQTYLNAKKYCVNIYLPPNSTFENIDIPDLLKKYGSETDSVYTMLLASNVPLFNSDQMGLAVVSRMESFNNCEPMVKLNAGTGWLSTAVGSPEEVIDAKKLILSKINSYQYNSDQIQLVKYQMEKNNMDVLSATMTFPLNSNL